MAPTQSRQIETITTKNGTRMLKPVIGFKRPDRGDKGKHDGKINVVLTPVKRIVLPTRFPWLNLGTEPLKSGYYSRRSSPGTLLDRTQPSDQPSTR